MMLALGGVSGQSTLPISNRDKLRERKRLICWAIIERGKNGEQIKEEVLVRTLIFTRDRQNLNKNVPSHCAVSTIKLWWKAHF
jgi:hypothetical protein